MVESCFQPMQLFLGAPYRALWQSARRALGGACRTLVPSGAARVLEGAFPEVSDWHGFLRRLTGVALTAQPTPEMTALLGDLCEQQLSSADYFGKVRLSPRFHSALAHSFCRWSADGLTPERLAQGAQTVLNQHAALAGLDDYDLQTEWRRKTDELVRLWQAWRRALQQAGLPEPLQQWQQMLDALQQARLDAPLLLTGFTELAALEIEALRLLCTKTQVALALLYDPCQPEYYAPTETLRTRLRCALPISEVLLGRLDQTFACGAETASVQALPELPAPVTILDTPDPLYEVETVAREILRLQADGVALEEIALLIRQPESAIEALEVIFARYEIPLQGEVGLPLERSWRVRWLMEGLRLLLGVGDGEAWLRWLEHPAHGLSFSALSRLRRRMRRSAPASRWLEQALPHADEPALNRLLRELNALRQQLPANLPQVARALLLRLGVRENLAENYADIGEWLRLIDAYQQAWRTRPLSGAAELLERLVSGARYTRRIGDKGVRILPIEYADLAGAQVVFVLQMLEGILPRRHPDDPFLREAERNALNRALHAQRVYLPTRADYQAGEPMLWQRVLQSARTRLYLSYARTQQGESDALPSLYLDELKAERERALEVRFYSLEQIIPADALHPYDQSLREPEAYLEPPILIRDPALRLVVADTTRPFSATELETLVRCPFQHFARYALRLKPLPRDLSLREVGSITHAALCRAARRRPTDSQWRDALAHSLQELLQTDAPDLPDWQLQVLRALTERLLRRLGWREPLYQAQFGVQPAVCEWAFGDAHADDEERTRIEPTHNHQPPTVRYHLSNGQQIALSGVIDRIDLSPDRTVALVVDYKLGSAPDAKEFREGRAIQGLLYLHAVRTILPNAQIALAYDRLKAARRVRFVPHHPALARRFQRLEWEDREDFQLIGHTVWRQAEGNLRRLLTEAMERLQAAQIEPIPGDHCKRCAFSDLCRRASR
ncbi:MAG: PD-(D/E)XK nuclease family protein [Fimbriimonadales bacterium]|nr:PD-(D/E)XK nuclease family protein [Fimbriimonadales bacterium]